MPVHSLIMNIDLYAYLLLGLFFLVLWLICFATRTDLRSMMLRASVAGALSGPLSEWWYFRDYWSPPTLLGQGVLSLEDVLFGFAAFGVSVAALPVLTGKRFASKGAPHPWALPFFVASFFVAFLLFTDLLGINSILAASIVMLAWAVGIVTVRREMLLFSIASGALMAIFSIIIYVSILGIANDYLRQYWFLWGTPLGLTVFGGVPMTEVVWYFCLGSSLVVMVPYAEGKELI